jgi:LPPG:FO 2-phospho-L-lactate transferase
VTVVVLAGGSGGAKLARGMRDVCGDELVVVANTGDDVEQYGAHVSPDPDLCTFWLADRIDARGWGIDGDTFRVMDALRGLGVDVWFNLGDEDLAVCIERARRLAAGERQTVAHRAIATALGVEVPVLPMSDAPVRTRVRAAGTWWDFQEFMIRHGGSAVDFRGVEDVAFDGVQDAAPTPEVLEAVAAARAIVIGPSNPVISIGPILALPGMREALAAAPAPVVAVSPVVAGHSVKGPTEEFLRFAGADVSASGVAAHYGAVLDGIVTDEDATGLSIPALSADTMMRDASDRERVARVTLDFALGLGA